MGRVLGGIGGKSGKNDVIIYFIKNLKTDWGQAVGQFRDDGYRNRTNGV